MSDQQYRDAGGTWRACGRDWRPTPGDVVRFRNGAGWSEPYTVGASPPDDRGMRWATYKPIGG